MQAGARLHNERRGRGFARADRDRRPGLASRARERVLTREEWAWRRERVLSMILIPPSYLLPRESARWPTHSAHGSLLFSLATSPSRLAHIRQPSALATLSSSRVRCRAIRAPAHCPATTSRARCDRYWRTRKARSLPAARHSMTSCP